MATTIKLTDTKGQVFDASLYLKVNPDEGASFDGGGFNTPTFTDSPFGDGQEYISTSTTNKEKVYPLFLKSTGALSTDGMIANQSALLQVCLRASRLEECIDGASKSTFFDVEFARFDPETNLRRSAAGWKLGTLHVWVKPYGDSNLGPQVIATGARIGPVVMVTAPSNVGGDALALTKHTVSVPSIPAGDAQWSGGLTIGVSQLPHASWNAWFPVGSSNTPGNLYAYQGSFGLSAGYGDASVVHAPGSLALTMPDSAVGLPVLSLRFPIPSVHGGDNRILLLAKRSGATVDSSLQAFESGTRRPLGPPVSPSFMDGLGLVDMGVFSMPTTYAQSPSFAGVDIYQVLTPIKDYYNNLTYVETRRDYGEVVAFTFGGAIALPADTSVINTHSRRLVSWDAPHPGAPGAVASIGYVDQMGWGHANASPIVNGQAPVSSIVGSQTLFFMGSYGIGQSVQLWTANQQRVFDNSILMAPIGSAGLQAWAQTINSDPIGYFTAEMVIRPGVIKATAASFGYGSQAMGIMKRVDSIYGQYRAAEVSWSPSGYIAILGEGIDSPLACMALGSGWNMGAPYAGTGAAASHAQLPNYTLKFMQRPNGNSTQDTWTAILTPNTASKFLFNTLGSQFVPSISWTDDISNNINTFGQVKGNIQMFGIGSFQGFTATNLINASIPAALVRYRVTEYTNPPAIQPGDTYTFDGVNAQGVRQATTPSRVQLVTVHGAIPRMSFATPMPVMGFAIPIDGGPVDQLTSLIVRTQERFTFHR